MSSTLESKIDKLTDSVHSLDKKVDLLSNRVEDIQQRTISHDNLTREIERRVEDIENLALVPRKIFDFVWKVSLFVGVVYSIVKFIKP